jgi:hypothetical protein
MQHSPLKKRLPLIIVSYKYFLKVVNIICVCIYNNQLKRYPYVWWKFILGLGKC